MFSTWISTQAESALYSEMKAPLTILHKKLKLRIALNYRSFPRGSDLPHWIGTRLEIKERNVIHGWRQEV